MKKEPIEKRRIDPTQILKRFYSLREVSERWGVSLSHVRNMVNHGLPTKLIGPKNDNERYIRGKKGPGKVVVDIYDLIEAEDKFPEFRRTE